MTFISYAQNFEDVMLWRALRHIQNGCYIDIGANDPIVDSVSLAFYEHGWRGVHLEPTAQYANLLRQQRPDELVIQAAVSDSQKLLTFFEFPDTGLSTLDATIAAEHQQKGFRVLQTVTPTLTLDDVFAQNLRTDIHWLKIDVEGFEEAVLRGWNTSEVRPWIVVVESTLPMSTKPSHQHWEALVLQKGYQFVYFDGLNRYYVSDLHPELMAEPWIPPNVFDGFTIDGRASNVFSQDIQRRLQAATQSGQQSAVAELQASEQAKQTLLNQLAETRGLLELQAASAREEHQLLSRQLKDARDELGQMVRLVSQREKEFSQRFKHFQADYLAVSQLLQQERDQAAAQLQTLQQQLQTQQQQYQAELQRHRELEDKLSSLQQQLREKEQAFASQLLQLYQQKNGQQKVFQIREQSLRTELQRAREEIQRVGDQYQAELQDLRQTNETLNAETARYQQQYLELQHEFKLQLEQVTAELQQQIDAAQTIADEKAEALTALQLDAERQQAIAAEQFNQLQQQSAEEYLLLQQASEAELQQQKQQSAEEYQALLQQHYADADQHTAELHSVQEELSAAYRYVERHQHEIAQLSSERELLKQELTRLSRSFVDLRADVKDKARKNTKFISALQTRHQLRLQQTEQEHQQIRQLLAGELSQANTTLTDLSEQLAQSATAMQSLEEFAGQQAKEAELQIIDLSGQLQQTSESMQLLQHTHADKIAKAEAVIHQLTTQLDTSKVKLVALEAKCTDLQSENIDLDRDYLDALSSIDALRERNREIENQLHATIQEYNDEIKKIKSAVSYYYHLILNLNKSSSVRWVLHALRKSNFFVSDKFHEVYFHSITKDELESVIQFEALNMNGNHLERSNSVNEIFGYSGYYFIVNAFITLLNRVPDEEGLKVYLAQLHIGVSKEEILYQIVQSAEWNNKKIKIPGLSSAVRKVSWRKQPIIGNLVAYCLNWSGTSVQERQLRTLETQISNLGRCFEDRVCTLESKVDGVLHRLDEQSVLFGQVIRRIDSIEHKVNGGNHVVQELRESDKMENKKLKPLSPRTNMFLSMLSEIEHKGVAL